MSAARIFGVDLGSSTYRLDAGATQALPETAEAGEETWMLTDFGTALARVMEVEAPAKYAEMVVRKRLQDAGEFDEPVHVLTHWKRARGAGITEIFFTALPIRQYLGYMEKVRNSEHGLLLFPVHGVLWNVLRALGGQQPALVLLAHERFVDLVVGTPGRPLAAYRLTAYAAGEEALEGLWQSVRRELQLLVRDRHLQIGRVLGVHWLEDEAGLAREVSALAEDLGGEPLLFPGESIRLGEETRRASLPELLRSLSAGQSVSPPLDRAWHYARRALPWATVAALALNLCLAAAGLWYGAQATESALRADRLHAQLSKAEQSAPGQPVYKPALAFAETLQWARRAPSYRQVVNGIAAAMTPDMRLDTLTLDYPANRISVVLYGHIDADFNRAQNAHQGFLAALRQAGYKVTEQQFTTSIDTSLFSVKLERSFQ